jgi:hypothetical protein
MTPAWPLSALALSCVAAAQPVPPEATTVAESAAAPLTIAVTGDYWYQTKVGVGEAEFDKQHAAVGMLARFGLTDGIDMSAGFSVDFDGYEFSGSGVFGQSPWDNIITTSAGALLSVSVNDETEIFGGPIFRLAHDIDADPGDDSFMYGGTIGFRRQWLDNLRVGLGVGIITQIEDDARWFPVVAVDWEISDDWRVRSISRLSVTTRPGAELVWHWAKRWESALGVAYENSRFRLDEESVAPDGIGEDTSYPIWVRTTYAATDDLSFDLWLGFVTNGELEVEDEGGHHIASKDYETAFLVGMSVAYRF